MMGVLMAFAALMISLIRGTPSVTFIEATPAKWKVFNVIWVPGSPIDWAPTAPTVEPSQPDSSALGTRCGTSLRTWLDLCLHILGPADI